MKINLIRQDTLKYRKAQKVRLINSLIILFSLAVFGPSVLWVSGQYVYYAVRQNSLNLDVTRLKSVYAGRVETVADYLAVKQIVAGAEEVQSRRFKYKEFLSSIYSLLPSDATLAEVSFGVRGVVLVGVRFSKLNSYDILVANVEAASMKRDFLFGAVSQKSMTREKTGGYLVTLELTIKK